MFYLYVCADRIYVCLYMYEVHCVHCYVCFKDLSTYMHIVHYYANPSCDSITDIVEQ